MPISYKSIVHKPIDYTQPVDLNLLGKVLQFEQGEFDKGVKQVQGTIDSIAALDVVKDVDRQYLNSKLNNLVSSINNIGGVDYSDPNVQNQISGMSSQIYGDDKIINAVGNTKKFRYVQTYYKDLKEKKPKDWNQANEWYDMNKFSNWLQDGQVGSSTTNDAGTVTPYHDYQGDWEKLFDKIANSADISVQWSDRGLMYMKDGKKYVSPDRIWATASMMLTPQQRTQLAIEGRYTYQGVPVSELTKAYDAKLYQQVGEATNELRDYQTKLKGATSLKDQQDYQRLVAEKQAEVAKLTAPIQKNADQMREKLYLDEKFKGLQARYSFSQATSTMQAATDKMFKLNYDMQKAKFAYQQQNDQLDRMVDMADKGLMWGTDAFGNRTAVIDPSNPRNNAKSKGGKGTSTSPDASMLPVMGGAMQEQNYAMSEKALDTRKTALVQSNNQLFNNFVKDFGWKMGWTDAFVNDFSDDGFLQGKYDERAVQVLKDYKAAWDASMRGEKVNFDHVDPMFRNFISKWQENQKEIESIDNFYNQVDNQVREKFGLTGQDMEKAAEYVKLDQKFVELDKKYPIASMQGQVVRYKQDQYDREASVLLNRRKELESQLDRKKLTNYMSNRGPERQKLIERGSMRFNLPGVTISDDKEKNTAKMAAANAATMQYYDQAGNVVGKAALNPDNIEPMSIGYDYIQAGGTFSRQPVMTFRLKTGSKADEYTINKVPLSPQQAPLFGFGSDMQDLSGYRFALHATGKVADIGTTSGTGYQLKYDMKKYKLDDVNDNRVFVIVHGKSGPISLYNTPFNTPELAQQYMEGMTKLNTFDDAIIVLDQLSRGQVYNK
jgi:hypothetical protein